MKQRMVLIISVVVGLLAFGMTQRYFHVRMADLEKERAELISSEKRVEVIAAGRDLPAGTVLIKKDQKYPRARSDQEHRAGGGSGAGVR